MPRYVILEHDHPLPHWDFMIEAGARLRAWRLLDEPARGRPIRAEAIGDHRTAYLDYEGPVGGGRGRVSRWDAGTYEMRSASDDKLRLDLSGGRAAGLVTLTRAAGGLWTWRLDPAQGGGAAG